MQQEDLKTLLTDKRVNETLQIIVVAISIAFVLFQIPSCVKQDSINNQNQKAAVKIAAIEAGLVQKIIAREGTSRTDIIWTLPDTEVPNDKKGND